MAFHFSSPPLASSIQSHKKVFSHARAKVLEVRVISVHTPRQEREVRLNEAEQHRLREGESRHIYKRASLMQVDIFISVAELQFKLIGTIPTSDIISFLPQCDSYDLMLQPLTSPLIPLPALCHVGDCCTANWGLIYNQKKVQRLIWIGDDKLIHS